VAHEAQASVPIPEGLDLDSWIIAPPKEDAVTGVTKNGVTKKNKGKGKEKAEKGVGNVKSGKKREKAASLIDLQSEETPEEKAERERVSYYETKRFV
jgi:AP-3 complex subunit delta